jgi:hypothetical protein
MQADPNISEFVALSTQVGLDADFNDPTKIMTVFAPQNGAMTVPPTDPEILAMLENFIVDGQQLPVTEIGAWPNPVAARGGASYAVTADPDTFGGAGFVSPPDQAGVNGLLQVMDAVPVPI